LLVSAGICRTIARPRRVIPRTGPPTVLLLLFTFLYIMETSFAITGKGYVIVAADTTAARSIVKMKVDEDKIKSLSPHLLMAYSGEPGMRVHVILVFVTLTPYDPKGILSNLPNMLNVTSVCIKFATSTLFVPPLLHRGFADHWQNPFVRANPTPSIFCSAATTPRAMSHICSGLTISGP